MTMQRTTIVVTLVLVGLSAGFFVAYQISVTVGLAEVDDLTYVRTFQAINEEIRTAWFAIVFFGSIPALCATVAVHWSEGTIKRFLVSAALGLYLAGIAITAAGNVPLNNNLAEYGELTIELAATARNGFEQDWNRLNLARTLAITASFVTLVLALTANSQQRPADPGPAGS